MRCPLISALSLTLLLAAGAAAGEKLTIVPAWQAGDAGRFSSETVVRQQVRARGDTPAGEQRLRQVRQGVFEVLAATDGRPTSVRVTFSRACANEAGGKAAPAPLAGRTVTLTRGADGQLVAAPAEAAPAALLPELVPFLDLGAAWLPPQPVAPGDTWTVTRDRLVGHLLLQDGEQAEGRCQFLRRRTVDGRERAQIGVAATVLRRPSAQLELVMELTGSLETDVAKGGTVSTTLTGRLHLRAGAAAGGATDGTGAASADGSGARTLTGSGEMISKAEVTLLDAAALAKVLAALAVEPAPANSEDKPAPAPR